MSTTSTDSIQDFLTKYIAAPKGKKPDAIRERLLHWIDRANNPEKNTNGDPSKFAVADVRRKARQNVRRIVCQHPGVAAQVAAQLNHEAQQ